MNKKLFLTLVLASVASVVFMCCNRQVLRVRDKYFLRTAQNSVTIQSAIFPEQDLLFNDSAGSFYNYCPSYIQTSPTERYIYYCRNQVSGQIKDYIYWRKATLSGSNWVWGAEQVALSPSSSGWDMVNVCDPDVKMGTFLYNSHTYSWVMFYLGADVTTNLHNQIGIAFADSPEGPWVKFNGNPLITGSPTNWGVGQPTATSVDWKGRFLIFYQSANGGVKRRDIDISNLSSISLGTEYTLFTTGLTASDNSTATMASIGIAYDGSTDRFYMVTQRAPYPTGNPTYISTQLQVAYTSGSNIWNDTGSWTVEGEVVPTLSGEARNHNATLLTDYYGVLIGGASNYRIAYTGADSGSNSLWSYRIYEIGDTALYNLPVGNIIYELAPHHAPNKRLDVANGADTNRTNVQIYHELNNNEQKWQLVDLGGSGYFQLIPQNATGERLDVAGADTASGTNVWIWEYNGNYAQEWKLIDLHNGYFGLAPHHAETKRLDVAGADTTDGANVWIWDYNGNYAQQWMFIPQ